MRSTVMMELALDEGLAPGFGARSFSARKSGHENFDEDYNLPAGYTDVIVSHPTVDIDPGDLVARRAITCGGMTTETIRARSCARIEYRFRAPVNLLVIYEDGARREGETFVEGLSPGHAPKLRAKTHRRAGRRAIQRMARTGCALTAHLLLFRFRCAEYRRRRRDR